MMDVSLMRLYCDDVEQIGGDEVKPTFAHIEQWRMTAEICERLDRLIELMEAKDKPKEMDLRHCGSETITENPRPVPMPRPHKETLFAGVEPPDYVPPDPTGDITGVEGVDSQW